MFKISFGIFVPVVIMVWILDHVHTVGRSL